MRTTSIFGRPPCSVIRDNDRPDEFPGNEFRIQEGMRSFYKSIAEIFYLLVPLL